MVPDSRLLRSNLRPVSHEVPSSGARLESITTPPLSGAMVWRQGLSDWVELPHTETWSVSL